MVVAVDFQWCQLCFRGQYSVANGLLLRCQGRSSGANRVSVVKKSVANGISDVPEMF